MSKFFKCFIKKEKEKGLKNTKEIAAITSNKISNSPSEQETNTDEVIRLKQRLSSIGLK